MKDLFASKNPEDADEDIDPASVFLDFQVLSPTDREVSAAADFDVLPVVY
jgi:hypothetical protein